MKKSNFKPEIISYHQNPNFTRPRTDSINFWPCTNDFSFHWTFMIFEYSLFEAIIMSIFL